MHTLTRVRPGVSVAILAGISFLYTLVIEHPSRWQKVTYVCLAAIFTLLEIVVIYASGRRADRELSAARRAEFEQFRINIAQFRNIANRVADIPRLDLRSRAIELSDSLLELVEQKMFRRTDGKESRRYISLNALMDVTFSPEQLESFSKTIQLGREVETAYNEHYAAKVKTIRGEFAEHGLNSQLLDEHLSMPDRDYIHIALIGEELSLLANKLMPISA